jgi:UDP-glucuronate 4-epimerase
MGILITGAAGFIGMHVCESLLKSGIDVVGVDNLNHYYDVNLKKSRLKRLLLFENFKFHEFDLENMSKLQQVFSENKVSKIVHLAAQAGVRYSLENPRAYISANIDGFLNILEAAKENDVEHLVYASSSSVYGSNSLMPFSEDQNVDHPLSMYAATKKSNELMAHTYSHLYNIPTTGLRFFTVYGPWGRPDMALFIFCKSIIENDPIDIYNHGQMQRGFTYISDIVEGIIKVMHKPATPDKNFIGDSSSASTSSAPYRIFNIGNPEPCPLMDYINSLENILGIEAKKNFMDIQPGDVSSTSADTSKLENWIDFKPGVNIQTGITEFVKWYREYYK